MPTLRSRHSSTSAEPVVSAIFGRCPSLWLRGSLNRSTSVSGVFVQAGTLSIVTSRRHLPTWMTSGMLVPTGMSPSVNAPVTSVLAIAIGSPDSSDVPVSGSHGSQLGPSAIGASGLFGT